jgi:hypothetical protein
MKARDKRPWPTALLGVLEFLIIKLKMRMVIGLKRWRGMMMQIVLAILTIQMMKVGINP